MQRDYTDEAFSAAWKRIVEKKGSPVPEVDGEDGKKKTQEQLLAYARNCEKYLEHALECSADPAKNSDRYWDAAAEWWRMRIEALKSVAARRRTVPCPPPPHTRQPSSLKRTASALCLPIAPPKKMPNLFAELMMPHQWNEPMTRILEDPLETSYAGSSWTTTPHSPPSSIPDPDGLPVTSAPCPASLTNCPSSPPTPSSKPSTDSSLVNQPELKGFLGLCSAPDMSL